MANENALVEALADAIFHLAKASAEYSALPALQRDTGRVNPAFTGELLQTMQDASQEIARLLLAGQGQP